MEIRQVYLIERALTDAELEGFRVLLRQAESHVYLTHPHEELESLGAQVWTGLSAEEKKEANRALLEGLYELGHIKIGKDTLAAKLSRQGFQTWYYHKFRINYSLQPLYQQFCAYRTLTETYDRVTVYTQTRPHALFLRDLPMVEFVYQKGAAKADSRPSLSLKEQLKAMASRFLKGWGQEKRIPKNYPEHLFVLNNAHYRSILDPQRLPGRYTDNMFVGYFLKQYSDRFLLIDKRLFEKGAAAEKDGVKRGDEDTGRMLLNNEWVEWPAFLNPLMLFRVWRFNRHLKRGYKQARRKIKDPFARFLLREVVCLHRSTLYFYAVFLAYRSFFRYYRFTSVTLLDEYSPNFRAIVDAAKREGIRTQAIQHGALAAFNPGYTYLEKDARFSPWPDRLLVWGEFWKEFLTRESSYPREVVIPTGQLRTDVIPALQATPLKAEDLLGREVNDKFLILLATQPITDPAIRRQAALDTFTAAAALPGSWVLLKPHPRESDAAAYYPQLAQEAGCSNYTLLPDVELYLALRICQVLVHCYSTVGVEAVYFGLPAIILDYLKQDPLHFAAEGVALQATSAAELLEQLQAIRQGKAVLDPGRQQAYINKYAYAIDGRVAERTAQALLAESLAAEGLPARVLPDVR
ncbi:hypothetical protein [Cesiribacter andamanensis]|uniref:CDP-Glycerol:Poly(Glycerophosphate) glycerophosphotransferase n=1 Tax=Cesiribacter andamanensis AMV16 TaxID=1279009 RepID=M7N7G6_9BACT|nr:hypothetical protein [Cesiribacter andamanensis]EMR03197.1 hypothetical protein ADICEAN_01675 [Cesiribacter andamanensis AMV16]